jgi:hypothetical protein
MEDFKREEIIPFITTYYDQIGRTVDQRPNYFAYSLLELRKCLYMFGISLVREVKKE